MTNGSTRRPQVVTSCRVFPETLALLSERCDVVANQTDSALPPDALLDRCRTADALMAFMPDCIDATFLDACSNLRVIGCALKGFDNFDVDACTARRVWVSIVPDLLTDPTAELAIGLMIAAGRKILDGDRAVRDGFTGWRPILYGTGLCGSTVGIIGMGRVGRAIAERLQGFRATLLYNDRGALSDREERRLGVSFRPIEDIAAASDFVVAAVPLLPDTKHLIDAAFIGRMKPGAFLVNPARGSVVDETAVAVALSDNRLGGYAADVFAFEDWALDGRPTSIPTPLIEARGRTVLTPHIGSAVTDVRRAIERDAAENILEALAGAAPHGAINRIPPTVNGC